MANTDIANLLQLESADLTALEAASTAVRKWACNTYADTQVIGKDRYHFMTAWEPPFKKVKQLSKEHAAVQFTLWGDALSKHHWICKSIFSAGKSQDWVVSIVDDDFEQIFTEVYGQDYTQWKADPQAPFAALLQTTVQR